MAVVWTKTKIIKNALAHLGQYITTLSDTNTFTSSASDVYDMVLAGAIGKANWRFAVGLQQLSQSVEDPLVDDWEHIYYLPADFEALIRLYPDTRDFMIYHDPSDNRKVIYANEESLTIEYLFIPNEALFPSYFAEYLTYAVGARLALVGAESETYFARLDGLEQRALVRALAADGKNNPTVMPPDSPIIDARR